ncbi:MAG: SurA N-terminal domain-containing protein [Parabacteroides sp.]|nr:SurA N-terminal domain-containing protein [Parabacteroides sp.]
MATLEKIRSKAGLLVLVVGLALFAFIIGDFLNSGSTYFRQTQERVGEINGEVISIHDYQARVDEMTEMYKMQTGSTSLPEEYLTQIRQSVFDAMVQDIVLGEETEKIGMEVSPEELFDMVQGENISPMIQQMQMFVNPQTGAFDRNALLNFLKTIDNDNIASMPAEQQDQLIKARNFWLFWERISSVSVWNRSLLLYWQRLFLRISWMPKNHLMKMPRMLTLYMQCNLIHLYLIQPLK